MAKGKKKKHSKKDDASDDILDVAALYIKKFRKVTREISKLSTGQKLVGGIALVAAGLAYLATQEEESGGKSDSEAADAPLLLRGHHDSGPSAEGETEAPAKPHKPRKSPKAKLKPSPEA